MNSCSNDSESFNFTGQSQLSVLRQKRQTGQALRLLKNHVLWYFFSKFSQILEDLFSTGGVKYRSDQSLLFIKYW